MRSRGNSRDEQRRQILARAWVCFSTLGNERNTIALLLKRLGIAKETVYNPFDSREAALDPVAARVAGEPLAELKAVVEDPELPARTRSERPDAARGVPDSAGLGWWQRCSNKPPHRLNPSTRSSARTRAPSSPLPLRFSGHSFWGSNGP